MFCFIMQALVICPTRELAMQVCHVAAGLKRHCGISSVPVYGGQSKHAQIEKLQRISENYYQLVLNFIDLNLHV